MNIKRFFKLQEELITIHGMCLVIDFDSWGLGYKRFFSYEQFKKFIIEEFNDEKTVLQTAFLTSLNGGVFRYMCFGKWADLPMRIETVD